MPVDAILCPGALIQGANDDARAAWVKRQFGPALGNPRYVFVRKTDGDNRLIAGGNRPLDAVKHDRRYEADDHPNAGGERYVWTEQPEGWSFGVLADSLAAPASAPAAGPTPASAPAPPAMSAEERQRRVLDLVNNPSRTPAETEEMNRLLAAMRS